MEFKIIDVEPKEKNTLKALFTLAIGPIRIEGWTYHVKNDKNWVSPPSKEYTDTETGEKKYYPMIRIPDKDRYWKFQEWAKNEVYKQLMG